ncbi:hypothetical protein GI383_19475 [Salmonella enterica]|nr:hypothetical protein [Salmonella enterica]EEN5961572.1 hypothetical protein [Salmonella enterica]
MGSVAWQEEVGIAWVWGNGSSFSSLSCFVVFLLPKQFVYMLIKRNENDSERVCYVVVSGVVLVFSSQGVGLWYAA